MYFYIQATSYQREHRNETLPDCIEHFLQHFLVEILPSIHTFHIPLEILKKKTVIVKC